MPRRRIPGTLQLLSDLVTVHMPFVYLWVWILTLWLFSSGFLHLWRNQNRRTDRSTVARKRDPGEFFKLFAKVLFGLSLLSCTGVGLLVVTRTLGPVVLAVLTLVWWAYFGLGFVRPRSNPQRLTDRVAAGVLILVAVLFSLYIDSTGPSYYLARLDPRGGQSQAYVRSLAAEQPLAPSQVQRWLGSDLDNLRGNTLVYLRETGVEPNPELREKIGYLAEYDRSEAVRELAAELLKR